MRKRIMYGLIAILVAGIIFGVLFYLDKKEKSKDSYKFKVEYESLNGETSQSGRKKIRRKDG